MGVGEGWEHREGEEAWELCLLKFFIITIIIKGKFDGVEGVGDNGG